MKLQLVGWLYAGAEIGEDKPPRGCDFDARPVDFVAVCAVLSWKALANRSTKLSPCFHCHVSRCLPSLLFCLASNVRLLIAFLPLTHRDFVAVAESASLQRTYRLFRTLGLRHLCVVNHHNQVRMKAPQSSHPRHVPLGISV